MCDLSFRSENKCYYPNCKNKVHILSTICDFCHEKYCLSHGYIVDRKLTDFQQQKQ
jgi:hypothetical protein